MLKYLLMTTISGLTGVWKSENDHKQMGISGYLTITFFTCGIASIHYFEDNYSICHSEGSYQIEYRKGGNFNLTINNDKKMIYNCTGEFENGCFLIEQSESLIWKVFKE